MMRFKQTAIFACDNTAIEINMSDEMERVNFKLLARGPHTPAWLGKFQRERGPHGEDRGTRYAEVGDTFALNYIRGKTGTTEQFFAQLAEAFPGAPAAYQWREVTAEQPYWTGTEYLAPATV